LDKEVLENVKYKDLDQLLYDEDVIRFLRKKLDNFTLNVFREVLNHNKEHRGLVKTRMENFHNMRKRYDAAFLTLEVQGFIEKREDGTATPYYVTVRGLQLLEILKQDKKESIK
jgi:predicted transcriptional regulator